MRNGEVVKPNATTIQSGGALRQALRSPLAVIGLIGVIGATVAVVQCGVLRQSEDAALGGDASSQREVADQRAPSPAKRMAVSRPALPDMAAGGAAAAERPSSRAMNKLVRTQMKVQKYVEEAYPAWRAAHPGEDCPHELSELNAYMGDLGGQDTKDGWGRPLRMFCGVTLKSGAKGFKVVSYGRDAEPSEDDIKFEQ